MEGKNIMMAMEKERTNSFFCGLNKMRINIAFRIKEFLDPDCKSTAIKGKELDLFLIDKHDEAVELILNDIDIESSNWHDELHDEAVELSKKLVVSYRKMKITEKTKKREALLRQLEELDN